MISSNVHCACVEAGALDAAVVTVATDSSVHDLYMGCCLVIKDLGKRQGKRIVKIDYYNPFD